MAIIYIRSIIFIASCSSCLSWNIFIRSIMFTSCTIFIHTASCIFRPILYLQKAAPQNLEAVPNSKSSGTTGKLICAECHRLCRVPAVGKEGALGIFYLCRVPLGPHSAKWAHVPSTHTRCAPAVRGGRVLQGWHSAKTKLRRVPATWHSAKSFFFFAFKLFYSQLKFEKLIPGSMWYFYWLFYYILLFFLFAGNILWSYF